MEPSPERHPFCSLSFLSALSALSLRLKEALSNFRSAALVLSLTVAAAWKRAINFGLSETYQLQVQRHWLP